MKHIKKVIALAIFMTINVMVFSQNPLIDPIVRDGEGNPLYLRNQMIVKFHPDLVNTNIVNNRNIQSGIVSEFINPLALQMIIDSGYFNSELANLKISKIHHNMTTAETMTITRIGEEMDIPKFWSTFLIEWSSIAGLSFDDALDTLNTIFPIIEYAHPNYLYELHTLANDALFVSGDQAGLYPTNSFPNCNININPAWDLTVGRDNVRVGVYDEGINWDHEDFSQDNSRSWAQSRVKGGWDWVNNVLASNSTTLDVNGHGSSCAGIIGAIRNNDRGVAGVAGGNGATSQWGVNLYAMKITETLPGASTNVSTFVSEKIIADAITEGATSFNGTYGYALNIMNHSWGGGNMGTALKDAIRYSYRNKVVLAISSGNLRLGGTLTDALYPASASDEWVLKVGANDQTGNRASFSVFGNSLDFIAPGVGQIYATTDATSDNTYNYNSNGTSFAAPHVAGVAGLMLSYINAPSNMPNNLAPEDVENLLQKFSTDITATGVGYDQETGFGRVNAGATIQNIRWPRFEVKHYTEIVSNSNNTKIQSNVPIVLPNSYDGLAAGTYIGDVYRIDANVNITQPSGRTILDVWNRNSSSTLWSGSNPVFTEVNSPLISWSQTAAEMRGFIFNFKTTLSGANVNKWFPYNLNGNSTFALTVYSENPTATGIQNISIDKNFVRVIPNPSNGNFTLMFTLLKSTELGIDVADLTGKIIYSKIMERKTEGHNEIELRLQDLNAGVYFCKIRTTEGTVTQKISIVK